jgi:hypothetical protein
MEGMINQNNNSEIVCHNKFKTNSLYRWIFRVLTICSAFLLIDSLKYLIMPFFAVWLIEMMGSISITTVILSLYVYPYILYLCCIGIKWNFYGNDEIEFLGKANIVKTIVISCLSAGTGLKALDYHSMFYDLGLHSVFFKSELLFLIPYISLIVVFEGYIFERFGKKWFLLSLMLLIVGYGVFGELVMYALENNVNILKPVRIF